MKITDAITILKSPNDMTVTRTYHQFIEARNLGRQALERLQRERKHGRCNVWVMLPGETHPDDPDTL